MREKRQPDNEFDFIDWVKAQLGPMPVDVSVGPGDDCAVIEHGEDKLLLKVDSVLEGVHVQFSDSNAPAFAQPEQAGYKVMARTISDIAAMGGVPRFALVATALPKGRELAFRQGLLVGLQRAARQFGVAIVGGDTKSWMGEKPLALSVSLLGEMGGLQPVLRSGAKPGDAVFVTGELGGSILGKHLDFEPRVEEGRWLAQFGASSMIDISDGLSGDLWHICRMSGVGARIEAESLPISKDAVELEDMDGISALDHALHDGEDFELLFTVDETRADELVSAWPFATKLSRIGTIERGEARIMLAKDGALLPLPIKGYEHGM